MDNYKKEINIDENKKVVYDINQDGYCPIHTITFKDNLKSSIIYFSKWDDYGFKSYYKIEYEEYKDLKKESHNINKNNPLYIPLLHLLNGQKELIIDDDGTQELEKKYMKIYKKDSNIAIDFIYNLDDLHDNQKFYIFIKNISSDGRSKITCLGKDTKERLYFFFKEVYERFEEEYHQITIDEYLENNNKLSLDESKKYVKKFEWEK